MNYRTYLLTTAIIFAALALNAQDKIYKKNGGIIDAKVKEVTPTIINYKRFDNPNGRITAY